MPRNLDINLKNLICYRIWYNIEWKVILILDGCVPYSQQACSDAADDLGLLKGGGGRNFVGDYTIKGCYAFKSGRYANMAYYGTGGSAGDMQSQLPITSSAYRLTGYDCSVFGNNSSELITLLCFLSINFMKGTFK